MKSYHHAYIPASPRIRIMEKGVMFNEKSELILKLDIGYGRMLLDMFAIIEENGALNQDMARLYDLLKRQIPQ